MNKRNNYTAEFKTKVVLEGLQEEATLNEIASRYDVSPVVISRWKSEFLERAADVFKKGPSEAEKELAAEKERVAALERKVGQLTYEVDWLKKKSDEIIRANDRKECVDKTNGRLSVQRQAELLGINRTSLYRQPALKLIADEELFIMRRIDEIHTDIV